MQEPAGQELASTAVANSGRLRAFAALALVIIAVACFRDAFLELTRIWAGSPNESHGYLVAVLVPALVWMQRERLGVGDGLDWQALLTFALLLVACVAASVAGALLVVAALVPALVLAAAWVALGRRALVAVAVPIGFFWFAVPLWSVLTPVLQWLTVKATTLLLAGVGVPAFVDGAVVTIPAGVFEVVGGCAGTNYLVVALTVSTLLAFLQRASVRDGVRLVAFAALVAIAMNWLRVTLLIVIGQATAMRSPLVTDHFWFGWVLFAIALVPVVLRGRALRAESAGRGAAAVEHASATTAVRPAAVAVAAAGFVLASAWIRISDGPAAPQLTLPTLSGWEGPMASAAGWAPTFPGAAAQASAAYLGVDGGVDVYVARYTRQTGGARLVGFGTSVAGDGWTESLAPRAIAAPGGAVTEHLLQAPDGRRRVVWAWYSVRGGRDIQAVRVRIRLAAAAFGATNSAGVVLLSAECREATCADARGRLSAAAGGGLAALDAGTART